MFSLEKRKLRADLVIVVHSRIVEKMQLAFPQRRAVKGQEAMVRVATRETLIQYKEKNPHCEGCAVLAWVLREAEGPPSLETFKTLLDKTLTTLSLVLL